MAEIEDEDWLRDPLIKWNNETHKPQHLKNADENRQLRWWGFHSATRIKLEGTDYFCRKILGAASSTYDYGLPSLAHRELCWYLDAFFFELMSSYDVLLQELNIIYAYDLNLIPTQVKWDNSKTGRQLKEKLPHDLLQFMNQEYSKYWFSNLRIYRNMATHHYRVPINASRFYNAGIPLDYNSVFNAEMRCIDHIGLDITEDISKCKGYLQEMGNHIISIWHKVSSEFEEIT